jgi:NAD(P)-dependent dehydrogenase (short-subunit alcohol dehydrogenase family)
MTSTTDNRPVAVVTGAGSGIGRAVALALATHRERPHRIVLVGRREAPLRESGTHIGTEGEDWAALTADIADSEQASSLPDRAAACFGRLDAVVNNAGWTPMKPVWEHTAEDIAAIYGVNAIGPVLITVAAVRRFRGQGGGRVVQVSSIASDDPFPGLSVYGGAKAGLNTLTKGLANELGPDSPVRTFCVAPGAVETELLRSIVPTDALPTEACLTPGQVAEVVVACAVGERDAESGQTIWMPSP